MSARVVSRALALVAFAAQPVTVSLGEVATWMGGAALAACLFLWAYVELTRPKPRPDAQA